MDQTTPLEPFNGMKYDTIAKRHQVFVEHFSGQSHVFESGFTQALRDHAAPLEAELASLRERLGKAEGLLREGAGYADEVTDSEGAEEFAIRARAFLSNTP